MTTDPQNVIIANGPQDQVQGSDGLIVNLGAAMEYTMNEDGTHQTVEEG